MRLRSHLVAICAAVTCAANAYGQANSTALVEFYNPSLDHYFVTWVPDEIAKLDAGTLIKGWMRTGKTIATYTAPQAGASPVCRYYIPPALGNSHFFGRGTAECSSTGAKNPSFVLEDTAFMYMFLPTLGACPADTTQVYRVFSKRPDANHRYTTDKAVRDAMVKKGWLAEGDGPDLVVMCAPAQYRSNVSMFTEFGNPLLLSVLPGDGAQTTLFGAKDAVGKSTGVTGLYMQAGPKATQVLMLDALGRPATLTMADGSTMKFAWQAGGKFSIDAVTANGRNQASVSLTQAAAGVSSAELETSKAAYSKNTSDTGTLVVSVTESGIAASGATVLAAIEGKQTRKSYMVPMVPTGPGPGVYKGNFVNTPSALLPGGIEDACNKIVETTSTGCSYLKPVASFMTAQGCLAIAAEVALVGTPVAGAVMGAGCEFAMTASTAVCKAVEVDSGTNGSVCKAIDATVALYDGDGVRITASATKGATSGSTTNEFGSTATRADMSIDLVCPPPLLPFNGTCGPTMPLTKTWVGTYKYAVAFGVCKVSYSGDAFMILKHIGPTFAGDFLANVYSINTTTCAVDGNSVPIFPSISGKIDGDNNITLTSTTGEGGSVYTGTGTFRNETLKVDMSNTSDFGGLGTFSITLR